MADSSYGIRSKMISTVEVLYNDFECAVMDEEDTTERLKIRTSVKQGCNLSVLLFLLVLDWATRKTMQEC